MRISVGTALSWGLISEVLPQEGLLERAKEIAKTISSRAPIAVETAKPNMRTAYSMPQEKAIEYERGLQTICFATEDAMPSRRSGSRFSTDAHNYSASEASANINPSHTLDVE
jgi:enoyl-CoA hydratase/carnithine racemase